MQLRLAKLMWTQLGRCQKTSLGFYSGLFKLSLHKRYMRSMEVSLTSVTKLLCAPTKIP